MKKLVLVLMPVIFLAGLLPVPTFAQGSNNPETLTAELLIDSAVRNFAGPRGKTLVAVGKLMSPGQYSDLCVGRAIGGGGDTRFEAFQIEFWSPVNDGAGGVEGTGRKYRGVRADVREEKAVSPSVSSSVFLPRMRRGRLLQWQPLDGVLGTDFKFYLLTPVSNMRDDFFYQAVPSGEPDVYVVEGMLTGKETAQSPLRPYTRSRIYLKRMGDTYVAAKIQYWVDDDQPPSTVEFLDYEEVFGAEGYWAPKTIIAGETSLKFRSWYAVETPEWMFSTNHGTIETQKVPCVTGIAAG